ncbi:RadC family protein [uncultured Oxalicibacterium sp.]|uniref:JAB domain-containing protein n=1 Tax=uncultured Oxalicibacterium sp. TaxID=1168540 RepID=UPI0025F13F4C|nr:DNA repair protein RadC [uncultured Oxalicibacterium sp.]
MQTQAQTPKEQDNEKPCHTWGDFLADLNAIDAWIVERALQILDERVIKRGPTLQSPNDVKAYLRLQLTDRQQECFAVIFLDCQHRVIAYEALFCGTLHQTSVYPRTVLQRAMALNAAGLILAHNHPSGITTPSEADKRLTKHLQSILDHIDVRILDHFIIGEKNAFSFAENGLLD